MVRIFNVLDINVKTLEEPTVQWILGNDSFQSIVFQRSLLVLLSVGYIPRATESVSPFVNFHTIPFFPLFLGFKYNYSLITTGIYLFYSFNMAKVMFWAVFLWMNMSWLVKALLIFAKVYGVFIDFRNLRSWRAACWIIYRH